MRLERKTFQKFISIVFFGLLFLLLISYFEDKIYPNSRILSVDVQIISVIIFLSIPLYIVFLDKLDRDVQYVLVKKYVLWLMILVTNVLVYSFVVENDGFRRVIQNGWAYAFEDFFETFDVYVSVLGIFTFFHYKMIFTTTHLMKYVNRTLGLFFLIVYVLCFVMFGPLIFYALVFNADSIGRNANIILGIIALITIGFDIKIFHNIKES